MTAQKILAGVLAVQVALAAATWFPRNDAVQARPVAPYAEDQIVAIQLESVSTRGRGADLVLARQGDGWVLRSENDFPVRSEPVDEMLERLLALRIGRPITDQPTLHSKLNVADDNFTRRVTLHLPNDETYAFLAGTASRQRMNIRYPGENEVYEAQGLGAWALGDAAQKYLDTKVLDVDRAQVASFQLTNAQGTLDLTRSDEGWSLPDGPVDPAATRTLITKALQLTMSRPADPSLTDPRTSPVLSVRWTLNDGTQGSYDGALHDGILAIRLGDDRLPPFEISKAGAQPMLLDASVATLRPTPTEP